MYNIIMDQKNDVISSETFDSLPDPTNSFVDKITLELLLNKTHYQKYLCKTDPQLYAEKQEFLESCSRFRRPIVDMTTRLLENPNCNNYSREVCDAFDKYAQVLIRYLEIKEMSDQAQSVFDNDDDDDTLFPESMNLITEKESSKKSKPSNRSSTLDSFILRK
jgi:hypothetical protein